MHGGVACVHSSEWMHQTMGHACSPLVGQSAWGIWMSHADNDCTGRASSHTQSYSSKATHKLSNALWGAVQRGSRDHKDDNQLAHEYHLVELDFLLWWVNSVCVYPPSCIMAYLQWSAGLPWHGLNFKFSAVSCHVTYTNFNKVNVTTGFVSLPYATAYLIWYCVDVICRWSYLIVDYSSYA